jgi:transportin-1
MLENNNFEYQEAAILALGAISDQDGCYEAVEVHLDTLVPFLIHKLEGTPKEVKSTTCWTLSKFSEWIANSDPIF